MRTFFLTSLIVLFSHGASPQTPVPEFEVASVKRSDATFGSSFRFLRGGRLSAMSWVKQLIQIAYGVEDYQVSGGPDWLKTDRYDIEAKAASTNADRNEMLPMLKSLLADRFKLQLREEPRDVPVYHLVVDRSGPKLRALRDGEAPPCRAGGSFICGITTP